MWKGKERKEEWKAGKRWRKSPRLSLCSPPFPHMKRVQVKQYWHQTSLKIWNKSGKEDLRKSGKPWFASTKSYLLKIRAVVSLNPFTPCASKAIMSFRWLDYIAKWMMYKGEMIGKVDGRKAHLPFFIYYSATQGWYSLPSKMSAILLQAWPSP